MKWIEGSFWIDWWRERTHLADVHRHLSDEQLLLFSDGEMRGMDARRTRLHLEACWLCRARQKQFQETIALFTEGYQEFSDADLPWQTASPPFAPRQLPTASGEPAPMEEARRTPNRLRWLAAVAGAGVLVALAVAIHDQKLPRSIPLQMASFTTPDSRITPGAAVRYNRDQVCSVVSENNRQVPASLRREVLAAYGIGDVEPRYFEVDYLITPALGGADDIRNMWPQTYSAEWNARVKDELEDRLRQMVCSGDLELGIAQAEIAGNWIAAYKKYFHTNRPIDSR
ncbi:MAG: hypothetical protein ABL967_02575 [Bryobacteraceae bacterium]